MPVRLASVPRQRRVGLGREEHRHDRLAGGHRPGPRSPRPAGRSLDAEVQIAAEVGPAAHRSGSPAGCPCGTLTAMTPGAQRDLLGVRRERQLGLDRRDLDPVDVVGPALAQLVDHPDDVLGVFRAGEAEVAVRARSRRRCRPPRRRPSCPGTSPNRAASESAGRSSWMSKICPFLP